MPRTAARRPAPTDRPPPMGADGIRSAAFRINLRHLRALVAVAAAGSVSGAAEDLYRVRSAVTRSISELEGALGRQLFDRRSRGMSLNSYGQLVLVRAQRIEQEFAEARDQLVARAGIHHATDVVSLFASILNGRRLAVIASLAEKRNMPAVAREFGLTQPAISTALRDLEAGLGVALFERGGARPGADGRRRDRRVLLQAGACRAAPHRPRHRRQRGHAAGQRPRRRAAARPHADPAAGDRLAAGAPSAPARRPRTRARTTRWRRRCAAATSTSSSAHCAAPPTRRTCSRRRCSTIASR